MKPLFVPAEFPIFSSLINLVDGLRYHATDQLNPSVTGNGTMLSLRNVFLHCRCRSIGHTTASFRALKVRRPGWLRAPGRIRQGALKPVPGTKRIIGYLAFTLFFGVGTGASTATALILWIFSSTKACIFAICSSFRCAKRPWYFMYSPTGL